MCREVARLVEEDASSCFIVRQEAWNALSGSLYMVNEVHSVLVERVELGAEVCLDGQVEVERGYSFGWVGIGVCEGLGASQHPVPWQVSHQPSSS